MHPWMTTLQQLFRKYHALRLPSKSSVIAYSMSLSCYKRSPAEDIAIATPPTGRFTPLSSGEGDRNGKGQGFGRGKGMGDQALCCDALDGER
jgi:hypothetical protein